MNKYIIDNKKQLSFWFLCILFFLFFLPQISFGAEGDIVWEITNNITSGTDRAYGVAVDYGGVYICGYQNNENKWRVEKRETYDEDGDGVKGEIIWSNDSEADLSGGIDYAVELATDPTGLYVVGTQNNETLWRVEKRDKNDGHIIWSKSKNLSGGIDVAHAIEVYNNYLYIAGGQDNKWRIEKRTIDGMGGSDDDGLVWAIVEDLSSNVDVAEAITIDPTGVYIGGYKNNRNIWRIEKWSLDGTLSLWMKEENIGPGTGLLEMTIDSSGVYSTGNQSNNSFWRVEKRDLTTGNKIWEIAENLSGGPEMEIGRGIAVSSTGVYVCGGQNNENKWRVEKRETYDEDGDGVKGEIIWSNDSEADLSGGIEHAHQVDFFNNGLYVIGAQNNDSVWRVERRIKIPEPNQPPNAIIDTPIIDTIITQGQVVNFTGHGNDTDGTIVAYSWTCTVIMGTCPASFPQNIENPGNITFNTTGQYTITYNVEDEDGDWDLTPDTRTITVNLVNQPPTASNFSTYNLTVCLQPGRQHREYHWDYYDDEGDSQSQYNFQIATDGDFNNLIVDYIANQVVPSGGTGVTGLDLVLNPTSQTDDLDIGYNQDYYRRVMVRSNTGNTDWVEVGGSYTHSTTQTHAYPNPNLSYIITGNTVNFTDESICYGGGAHPCKEDANAIYQWDFDYISPTFTVDDTTKGDNSHIYIAGTYEAAIKIKDDLNYYCKKGYPVNINTFVLPIPKWREIIPF